MNRSLTRILLGVVGGSLALVMAGQGHAQTSPAESAEPPAASAEAAAGKPPQIAGFEFTGFADVGYTHFTTGKGEFISGYNSRVFDFDNDVVGVQNIDLQLSRQPEYGFGGLLDVTLGKDADTIAAYGTIDKNKGPANGVDQRADLTQAFVYYGAGALNVIAGKFVTSAGAEVIKSRDDPNFSRSILFGYAIPFTHTGVRVAYKASETLILRVGANEGWDTIEEKNGGTSYEFGVTYTPAPAFSLNGLMLHTGQEKVYNYPRAALKASPTGTRNLVDLVATYYATDKLNFVVNYDHGTQEKATLIDGSTGTATWDGWALYANYAISDLWRISARGEVFSDEDGYRTAVEPGKTEGPTWTEGTLTLARVVAGTLELRGEVRFDQSDQKIFLSRDGSEAIDSQTSVGLEAIYKF